MSSYFHDVTFAFTARIASTVTNPVGGVGGARERSHVSLQNL